MDPRSHPPRLRPQTSTAVDARPEPVAAEPAGSPPLTPDEEVLVSVLIKRGLRDRRPDPARPSNTAHEHQRDLRQSILELNLISPELLNQLAFERLTALAEDVLGQARRAEPGAAARDAPALARPHPAPARRPQGAPGAGRHRDPARPGRPDPRAGLRVPRHRHPLRSPGDRPAGPLPDRRPAPGHPRSSSHAVATPMISRLKVMSNLNIVERRHSQDGRITIQHHNRPARPPRGDLPDDLRREDRHPDPRGR